MCGTINYWEIWGQYISFGFSSTFVANQNTNYIPPDIHMEHNSLQKNIYFVNFKLIKNNCRVVKQNQPHQQINQKLFPRGR